MANTFKFGNKKWAVKKDYVLAFNDEGNNFKPLPFDFTRDSVATYVDSDGLIKTATDGYARIDYTDNTDGHLILEPARTNLITYSEDFTNAYWTKQNSTASQSGVVGTITCSSDGNFGLQTAANTSSNVLIAVSIYVQDTSGNNVFYLSTRTSGQGLSGFRSVKFDLSTQIVVNIDNGESATITPFADNYYRLTYVFNADTSTRRGFMLYTSGTSGDTFKVKYAQHELGSYPTSYIPTEGSSVTRTNEIVGGITSLQSNSLLGTDEGTWLVDLKDMFFEITGTGLGSMKLYLDSTNQIEFVVKTNTSFKITLNNSVALDDISGENKIAISWDSSGLVIYKNGTSAYTSTNAAYGSAFTTLDLSESTRPHKINLNNMRLYNTRLTNAELETLTT